MAPRRRLVALLAAVLGATSAACDESAAAARREAAADSAARATLPPSLAEPLAVDAYLTDAYIAATPGASCVVQSAPGASDVRRRVRAPLPDSSLIIAYVRAGAGDAELRRVELLRRSYEREQIGFVWDSQDDEPSVVRWPYGLGRAPERALHPRGGPLPRVLRAMGRRLLTLRCDE